MRERFAERIRQLQRTNEEALEALQRAAEEGSEAQHGRLQALRKELATVDELHFRVAAAARANLVEPRPAEARDLLDDSEERAFVDHTRGG